MEITVSGRHTEVSDALRKATEAKIGKLGRFVEEMERATVRFTHYSSRRPDQRESIEVTLEGHGHLVRSKVAASDGFAALDLVIAKLEQQLHRLKTKVLKRSRADRRAGVPEPVGVVDLDGDGDGELVLEDAAVDADEARVAAEAPADLRIVRTKQFDMKPMDPQEAVLQMELVGHDFYLFTNAETDRAAVVYRRADGDVGLIEGA